MFGDRQEFNIQDYLQAVWKRRWIVLCVVLIVLVTNLVMLAAETPLFTSSAQVLIMRQMQPMGNQFGYSYYDSGAFTETQLRIMNSEEFLRKVADGLNQKEEESQGDGKGDRGDLYSGEPYHALLSSLRTVTSFFKDQPAPSPPAPQVQDNEASEFAPVEKQPRFTVGQIAGGLSVRAIPNTEIIQIVSTRPDPREAAVVANAVAETFIQDRLTRRLETTQQGIQWLQKQLKTEQVDLDRSRIELYEYMNKFGILSIDEKRGTKLDEELKLLEEKVRTAKENTGALEIKYQQTLKLAAAPNLIDTIPEAITNKVLADLRTQEIQLEQESIKLSATYGSNHPKVVSLQQQLKNIRDAKSQEIKKIVNALKVQYDTARLQEKSIVQARDAIQQELEDLKKRTVSYFALKREVESNEKVYDLVLNRLKETSLTEELSKSPNASILQHAGIPKSPSSPNVQKRMTTGLLLALALGIGLALLLEYLDNTFTKPDQIEQFLGLTFLGAVPSLTTNGKSGHSVDRPLVTLDDTKSSGAEAYRALRTNVLLSSADVQPQMLLVTSPGKSEGKSLTAANLSIAMAQAGNRVLLIDCDLRKPKMHKVFSLDRDPGLANLLVGTKVDPHLYIQKTAQPNLEVITCGPIPPNPSELLGSKRMHALLEGLREDYQRIILDSPPIMAATDAAVLTPVVDGTVLVVRAGDTKRQVAQRAVKQLSDLNARITGVVLNEIMIGRNGYYYYDYYYYQYGGYYGEEEPKKTGWRNKGSLKKMLQLASFQRRLK